MTRHIDPVKDVTHTAIVREVVFQFDNLIASLTARENVEIVTDISRNPMPTEQSLALVGLGERMDHFPSHPPPTRTGRGTPGLRLYESRHRDARELSFDGGNSA